MNLRLLDKKHFGRQGEPEDVIVGDSAGSYLTDARGRKYIDFMMGWCVGNLGWGNTEIRAAARKCDGPEYVRSADSTGSRSRFSHMTTGKSGAHGSESSSTQRRAVA